MAANGAGGPVVDPFVPAYSNAGQFFGGAVPEYVLPQSAGWAVIIGGAFAFAAMAWGLQWADVKFAGAKTNTEQFNTAGRTVGPGLIAVDVVSHWTWASIILSTGTYVWFYGAGSTMWFGTGSGTLTVWTFCVVAIELKHRAPKAHTFLEIVKLRWGKASHLVFFFFAIFINFFVSLGMMEAAVFTINAITGVNIYAAGFLIPLGVSMYACVGGLKATFTTSYLHTVVIYVVGLIFLFLVFVRKGDHFYNFNGIDEVYQRLQYLGETYPVVGNKGGSYTTGWSQGLLEINAIYTITAMSVLFCDQSYWQSAIAATPEGAVNGYAIGSFLYLGIVFMLPAGLGLGGLALDLPISLNEVYDSLVYPACAYALFGKAGVVLIVLVIFMAITSGGAGEMLAVGSLFTFDCWREYIRPHASGKELVLVSRLAVLSWAIIMGASMAFFNGIGVNVYWLGIWTGSIVSGAVMPVVYLVMWDRCTAFAATWCGAVFGGVAGLITWLVWPYCVYGAVTVDTTEQNGPVLASSAIGLGIGIIMPPIVTWLTTKPDAPRFDWSVFDNITFTDKESTGIDERNREFIRKYRIWIWVGAGIVLFVCEFAWPLLVLPAGVWSLGYFRFWIVLAFILGISSSLVAIFLPLWEGRDMIMDVVNYLLRRNRPMHTHPRPIPDCQDPLPEDDKAFHVTGDKEGVEMGGIPITKDDTAHGPKTVAV